MPPQLTPTRIRVLETVYQLEREGPVTPQRLMDALELGRMGVQGHLDALEKLGLLLLRRPSPRVLTIELTDEARGELGVGYPLIGEIAAGQPAFALEQVERRIETLEDLFPLERGDFFLKVRGSSMCNRGICDGDLALIRPQPWANDGDIVVALLEGDGTATLKFFFAEGDHVRLEPANPEFVSMTFPRDKVIVQGVYLGHVASAPRRDVENYPRA